MINKKTIILTSFALGASIVTTGVLGLTSNQSNVAETNPT